MSNSTALFYITVYITFSNMKLEINAHDIYLFIYVILHSEYITKKITSEKVRQISELDSNAGVSEMLPFTLCYIMINYKFISKIN